MRLGVALRAHLGGRHAGVAGALSASRRGVIARGAVAGLTLHTAELRGEFEIDEPAGLLETYAVALDAIGIEGFVNVLQRRERACVA